MRVQAFDLFLATRYLQTLPHPQTHLQLIPLPHRHPSRRPNPIQPNPMPRHHR